MQFLLFKEEKFYALCTLKDKNFAPKQNERDCPMTAKFQKPFIYKGFRDFIFARDATVMLIGRKCLIFWDFLFLYDVICFIRFYLLHYHLWLLLH